MSMHVAAEWEISVPIHDLPPVQQTTQFMQYTSPTDTALPCTKCIIMAHEHAVRTKRQQAPVSSAHIIY
eukprot:scaffold226942_cov18-Prasinocladus_malaysianus.AAC.2